MIFPENTGKECKSIMLSLHFYCLKTTDKADNFKIFSKCTYICRLTICEFTVDVYERCFLNSMSPSC